MPATEPTSRRRKRTSKLPPEVLQAAVTLQRAGRLESFLAEEVVRIRAAELTADLFRAAVGPVLRRAEDVLRTVIRTPERTLGHEVGDAARAAATR